MFILHGEEDEVISVDHGKHLHQLATRHGCAWEDGAWWIPNPLLGRDTARRTMNTGEGESEEEDEEEEEKDEEEEEERKLRGPKLSSRALKIEKA